MTTEFQGGRRTLNRAATTSPAILGASAAFARRKVSNEAPPSRTNLSAAFDGTIFGSRAAGDVQRRRSVVGGGGTSGTQGKRQLVRSASHHHHPSTDRIRNDRAENHIAPVTAPRLKTTIDAAVKQSSPPAPGYNPQATDQKIPHLRLSPASEAMSDDDAGFDTASVPATKSLVKLYEEKQNTSQSLARVESVRYIKRTPAPTIASSKPLRPIPKTKPSASILAATAPGLLSQNGTGTSIEKNPERSLGATIAAARSSVRTTGQERDETKDTVSRKAPLPPPPRRSLKTLDGTSERGTLKQLQASPTQTRPTPPKSPSHTSPRRDPKNNANPSPNSEFRRIAQSPAKSTSSRPALPPRASSTVTAPSPKPIPIPQRGRNVSQPQQPHRLSIDSLANAMVASSLASSRHPSPAKTQPPYPPPPRRHGSTRSLFHLPHHHHNSGSATSLPISRTPSPQKPFRTTMRKTLESDPEDGAGDGRSKGRRGRIRHPNKHHEGDRKRYRMLITERERKRYEGVWAANRGLLLPTTYDGDGKLVVNNDVCNLVVRDIWQRSRLGDEVLQEVWDLVDRRGVGVLDREEFVVGMWFCDWRLKGRKLPPKVPESVWGSVRRLTGMKVRSK